MSEKILITGGAGFIGSHLADRLLADGGAVTVLDNFSTGSPRNLAHHAKNRNLTTIAGSILDAELVDRLTFEHPLVFHLAATVGVKHIVENPLEALQTNTHGTENVLRAADRHGSFIVLASTSEIYGRSGQVPFREDGDRILGPTWVHRWSYSTSKALDEHLAFAYAERGVRVAIVRFFNSYGPRINENGYGSVIARFAAQALSGQPITVHGDGRQTRCFTYVADTVEGTILAARRRGAAGNVFNIGNDEEVSIFSLAERIRHKLRSRSEIVLVPYEDSYPKGFQDTPRRVPDTAKAADVLGFKSRVPLEKGLDYTLAWCRANYAAASSSL